MAYRRLGRFNKAAPTQVKTPYMVFSCHDDDNFPLAHIQPTCAYFNKPDDSFIQICAIDVGIRNCGIRIERRWEKANIVETVMLARIDFVKSEKVATNTIYYSNSIEILKGYLPHFEMCQYILIESQLPINYDAVRMSQHIITFLMANLANKGVKPMFSWSLILYLILEPKPMPIGKKFSVFPNSSLVLLDEITKLLLPT
jgi:hypothetical protein